MKRTRCQRVLPLCCLPQEVERAMNVFELTRALIDIESITHNEEAVGNYLCEYLAPLAAQYGGRVERMEVEPRRFNVFAQWGDALAVTLSTHMDTVPPFVASREDDEHVWGRGACDTKGIIAAMITAVERLLEAGQRGFGLLFVVGEERNSAGAYKAAQTPRGFAIHHQRRADGEPPGARLQRRPPLRGRRHRQNGALRLPRARRLRHPQAHRGFVRH